MTVCHIAGLTVRRHHPGGRPRLLYLPGIHGDWTLVTSFRHAVAPPAEFVELAYPDATEWKLPEYAAAVRHAVESLGLTRCWLLAESFGSLVAWALLDAWSRDAGLDRIVALEHAPVEGVILAGGFVRHPWPRRARFLAGALRRMPRWLHRSLLGLYLAYAAWRHRHAPETRATVHEFVERRTPQNRRAIQARLLLVAEADYRPVARRTHLPLFLLAGGMDPVVPWWRVRPWLRRHCPGFRAARIFPWADHNVLGTAPRPAAAQILAWITAAAPARNLLLSLGSDRPQMRFRSSPNRTRAAMASQTSAETRLHGTSLPRSRYHPRVATQASTSGRASSGRGLYRQDSPHRPCNSAWVARNPPQPGHCQPVSS
ncbi:MAG: hypothetical protein KatS3mg132_068 [Limisphaera sp.]|nr:MAG: hypothetical protein KatS3mg132_068 [Limisphaera sp.]